MFKLIFVQLLQQNSNSENIYLSSQFLYLKKNLY